MYQAGTPSESTLRRMEQFLRHLNARGRLGAQGLAYGLAELDGFHFHREGEPPPPSRVLPGDAGYATGSEDAAGETTEEDAWAVPDEPEDG
jgi:hypothetical protein